MKVRERRVWPSGMSGPREQECVRKLGEGDPVPAGAERVKDDVQEHDWRDVVPAAGVIGGDNG